MAGIKLKLAKDREEIILKFDELIKKANDACKAFHNSGDGTLPGDSYFELKVSSINLLSRLSSDENVYVEELKKMKPNAFAIKGVLEAARVDYLQGFIADHKLLVSAEVFSDLLVQAEILLDHDYKDAAAVIIRAVLEDGIRKLCQAHNIETGKRDTIQQLNEKLYKKMFTLHFNIKRLLRKLKSETVRPTDVLIHTRKKMWQLSWSLSSGF
jgi:hypothetical protein